MTLGTTPQPADVVSELRSSFPCTFPDAASRWLAEVGASDSIVFPTSFASKQAVKIMDTAVSTTAASTYTFSAMDAGIAYTGRTLVAVIGIYSATEAQASTSGVTIGGTAATGEAHGEFLAGSGETAGMGIYANQATGTTATVVVSLSAAVDACRVVLLSVAGLSSATASDTGEKHGTGSGSSSASTSLDIPADGVLIVGQARSNQSTISFSGVTKENQYTVGNGGMAVGFDNRLSEAASTSIGYSAGNGAASALIAMSYT